MSLSGFGFFFEAEELRKLFWGREKVFRSFELIVKGNTIGHMYVCDP